MSKKNVFKAHRVATVSFLAGLLFVAIAVWRQTALSSMQSEADQREEHASKLAGNVRNAQKLEAHVSELSDLNGKVRSRATDPSDLAANQQYFYRFEAETGVKITELRKAPAPAKSKGPATEYSSVTYIVTFEGNYEKVWEFVRKIETGGRISRIVSGLMAIRAASPTDVTADPLLNAELEVELLSTS